jgi:hypothetical protein
MGNITTKTETYYRKKIFVDVRCKSRLIFYTMDDPIFLRTSSMEYEISYWNMLFNRQIKLEKSFLLLEIFSNTGRFGDMTVEGVFQYRFPSLM